GSSRRSPALPPAPAEVLGAAPVGLRAQPPDPSLVRHATDRRPNIYGLSISTSHGEDGPADGGRWSLISGGSGAVSLARGICCRTPSRDSLANGPGTVAANEGSYFTGGSTGSISIPSRRSSPG